MVRSLLFVMARNLFIVCTGIAISSISVLSQPAVQDANPFAEYFDRVYVTQDVASSSNVMAFEKLAESIGGMTPAQISEALSVLDRQIDDTVPSEKHWTKGHAIYLLSLIAERPEGPELVASRMDHLVSMLNDPSHPFSSPVLMTLQSIGYRQPSLVWPILEKALDDPNLNNPTGNGPAVAVILLRMGANDDSVTQHVVKYMRRSDLTEQQLLATIIGIDRSPYIPDAVAMELVQCLGRSNESIKSWALVGIARSSPTAKDAARPRLQTMANDPAETPHTRKLAVEALVGEITEDPNPKRTQQNSVHP